MLPHGTRWAAMPRLTMATTLAASPAKAITRATTQIGSRL